MTTSRNALFASPIAVAIVAAGLLAADAEPRRANAVPAFVAGPTSWSLPTRNGQQPDLVPAPDGSLLFSWVEDVGDGQRLRFARYRAGTWSAAVTVAMADSFGNAVDTPRLRQTSDGAIWALWLRKNPVAGHARDIVIARSSDGGAAWSAPVQVNTDGTPTEHGFVSTWSVGHDGLGVAWLDGRAKRTHGDAPTEGAQMLRVATFDASRRRHDERVLDARVCDCCHTDAAVTNHGAVVVYRDRSEGEVRDIYTTRLEAGRWSTPHAVHADHWVMPGCPVNGPAVSADGDDVAVAWYTAAEGEPEVRVATSVDGGTRFGDVVRLARGAGVVGRVDVAVRRGRTAVLWLREDGDKQTLWLATLRVGSSRASDGIRIADLAGRGRATGMPRLAVGQDALHVVWTAVEGGRPVVHGSRIPLPLALAAVTSAIVDAPRRVPAHTHG